MTPEERDRLKSVELKVEHIRADLARDHADNREHLHRLGVKVDSLESAIDKLNTYFEQAKGAKWALAVVLSLVAVVGIGTLWKLVSWLWFMPK